MQILVTAASQRLNITDPMTVEEFTNADADAPASEQLNWQLQTTACGRFCHWKKGCTLRWGHAGWNTCCCRTNNRARVSNKQCSWGTQVGCIVQNVHLTQRTRCRIWTFRECWIRASMCDIFVKTCRQTNINQIIPFKVLIVLHIYVNKLQSCTSINYNWDIILLCFVRNIIHVYFATYPHVATCYIACITATPLLRLYYGHTLLWSTSHLVAYISPYKGRVPYVRRVPYDRSWSSTCWLRPIENRPWPCPCWMIYIITKSPCWCHDVGGAMASGIHCYEVAPVRVNSPRCY